MDIGKSFTYMFEDPNWIAKIAIGGGIILLGTIFSFLILPAIAAYAIVIGYVLVATKNAAEGQTHPLPEWSDIGGLFVKGITATIGVLIWFLPVLLLGCCVWLLAAATGGAARGDDGAARGISGAGGLLVSCMSCVLIIVSLLISFFVYAPLTRYALTNQVNVFWDFGGTWKFIQSNIGNYVIAWLIVFVANFIAGFGIIACIIGVFFTTFWAYLVGGHIFGQFARGGAAPTDSTPSAMTPIAPTPMEPTTT